MRCVVSAEYTQFQSCEKKFAKKTRDRTGYGFGYPCKTGFTAETPPPSTPSGPRKSLSPVVPSVVERCTGESATREKMRRKLSYKCHSERSRRTPTLAADRPVPGTLERKRREAAARCRLDSRRDAGATKRQSRSGGASARGELRSGRGRAPPGIQALLRQRRKV
jgi:hypothetical protein